ncbi:MAG: SDR family NAD(P)-dependent oxidoreductase [Candidatus Woesearchaeota archaeon]|jgi:hypothetical protein|nr:SDR family NAD(P)-dependent oxidoreductase [Candidatus Woesearchaeota archaeon]MDP7323250.1 SDR family NAD(P)-dependent oxidoreductase [Candidatus Woesearchaeota archaeon]MDP7457618.1 SDR family NAD(P)-dependent oxidoreductase [Candidatus Woesearchaeota archaeon]
MNIAIITGASSGLGYDFAKQIDSSYRLDEIWLIARRRERLVKLSKELKTKVRVLDLDLTKDKDLERIRSALAKEKPIVRLLVNNAGYGPLGEFTNVAKEMYLNMMKLNMDAVVELTYDCLQFMEKGCAIIQVASSVGFIPMPRFSIYAASKAFVLSFSNSLYVELKKKGIHVLAVCPGAVKTEFFQVAKSNMNRGARSSDVVRKALRDCRKKRIISVYGAKTNISLLIAKFLPRRWLLAMVERASKSF